MLFLAFVVCLLAVKKYRDIWKKISNRNKNANIAFSCILIWWLCTYFIKQLTYSKGSSAYLFIYSIITNKTSRHNSAGSPSFTLVLIGQTFLYFKLYYFLCLIIGNILINKGWNKYHKLCRQFQAAYNQNLIYNRRKT